MTPSPALCRGSTDGGKTVPERWQLLSEFQSEREEHTQIWAALHSEWGGERGLEQEGWN